MYKRSVALLALVLPVSAFALSNSFSYQGSLTDGGSPAIGSYDLQFQLQTSAGTNVGAPIVREDVNVAAGVFSVELDFGSAITSGDFRLQIGVRPGPSTGAFTTLAPTTNIRPTPQAQIAGIAGEAVTVSPNAIGSGSIQDNAVASADLLDGGIGSIDVNADELQLRVSGTCAGGSAIRTIANNGAVTCETVTGGAGGTVTSVATGNGLTGGPITTIGTIGIADGGVTSSLVLDGTLQNVDLAANSVNAGNIVDGSVGTTEINSTQVQRRVIGACASGSSIAGVAADGTVTCEIDDVGTGTVNNIATGTGLTGGPITASGTIAIANGGVGSAQINTAQVQSRVSGSCAAGSSIRAVAADGSVTCEADDNASAVWQLGGNPGVAASSQFLGTTDNNALVMRVNNLPALTLIPAIDNIRAPALLGGYPGNIITPGANGAAIFSGGSGFMTCGPAGNTSCINQVTASRGFIGGGAGNHVAGSEGFIGGGSSNYTNRNGVVSGGQNNRAEAPYAAVTGGQDNTASGYYAAIAGGQSNIAEGLLSSVPGGTGNCAGGDFSLAFGRRAKTRPGNGIGDGTCVTNSGDADGDNGSIVFADSTDADFISTGPNQFLVRANGGMMINTSTLPANSDDMVLRARSGGDPDADIKLITQNGTTGLFYLSETSGGFFLSLQGVATGQPRLSVIGGSGGVATLSNGGTWTNASSRSYKTDFGVVDPMVILDRLVALPIGTWTYRDSTEGTHLGPIAEDFKAAFNLAGDGKSIATVDADGVALAAIQGLNQKLDEENAALRAELAALRAMVETLAAPRR